MILLAEEIPRAADVFPLLYDDVKRCHVTIHGTSPFQGLVVHDRHLRLRIEQELREAQIRLRRAAVDLGAQGTLAGAVMRKVKQVRAPLRALFGLQGREVKDELANVVSAAAQAYGVDAKKILGAKEDAAVAYDELTKLVAKAVADVDRMEEP
jgi:hypothetical protein